MVVRGQVSDRAVVIVTKNGDRIVCQAPNRLGVQSGTPWLDSKGSRDWNIDPVKVMEDFESGNYYCNASKFIIGKWGTGYDSPDFEASVTLRDVKSLEAVPALVL